MCPWVNVIRSILAILLGLVLILWPGATLAVILVFFPIFVMIDGFSAIVIGMHTAKEGKWLSFVPMGILEILIGVFILFWPDLTITAFIFLMALWAFVLGLGEFFIAIADDKLKPVFRILYAVGGVLTFVLGICVISYPLMTSAVLIWLFGVFFLIYGFLAFLVSLWLMFNGETKKCKK